MSNEKKLEILLQWFDDNKIQWNKDTLEVRDLNDSFGVFAKKNMRKGKAVVKIPKECILSIKSTGIANILDEANLEGGCPLALAVLYELAIKEHSPWYGYLQSLPEKGADIPVFWTQEEKALLKGTEMAAALENDLNDLKDDYEELIQPILDAHPYIFVRAEKNDPYSFDEFLRVSSLISSRAFEVDAYHENALVPFADLFNHRSEGEHVHFETEYGVCDACGLMYCEHRYFDFMEEGAESKDNAPSNEEDEDEWEDEEDDAESMELDTELPDLEKMEEEGINFYDSDDGSDEEDEDTCDMVLDRDIKKGEEVFNTYGDHPNIALLSKYGFCYDDNKNDYLSIDENTIAECCIGLHTEALKETMPNASEDELQKKAVELVRPRWEFFMNNEHILCPDPNAEDIQDDFEDEDHHDHTHCDHDHDHENGHVHGENCDPSHDDDHTDGEEEEDEEHAVERSPPYYINWEGLFEDKVMCCLHIMFVNNETFADFVENTDNAVKYFEDLSNSQGQAKTKALIQVKSSVYKACRALAEIRKLEYEENGEWKSVKEETKERDELMYPTDNGPVNMRKYYALTCRIGEKKIIEKCIAYYSKMVKEWSGNGPTTNKNKKKPAKKNKKARY